jgi:hypothetical protein
MDGLAEMKRACGGPNTKRQTLNSKRKIIPLPNSHRVGAAGC